MKLSVIIVNYNVTHFLEQCLFSVMKSAAEMNAEIFVVDNNSVDGSCAMVKDKFPEVKLIENKKNTGFSFANNQAIRQSCGEYVLLLNPDTVVEEHTFRKVVDFMDTHLDAGGLGVKMIDGKGHFLPESKRGLPTPGVAFFKIFGLSGLFPKSEIFGKYHLGFLDKDKIHEVDVLSGAFMLLRKSALDKIGLLDEAFFMYGEDIDLSYRITKAGFKNFYFPETTIIHYKGESTKKGSVNYVLVFYKAMIIFAKKHFSTQRAELFSALINTAVYFRAFLAIITRFVKTIFIPAIDACLIFSGFYFIKPFWVNYKFSGHGSYPSEYLNFVVPLYIGFWLISIFFSGGYDKPVKLFKIIKGIFVGSVIILLIYSLLGENLRFSRALILIGASWTFSSILLFRLILHLFKIKGFNLRNKQKRRVVIVSFQEEFKRIAALLSQTDINPQVIGAVSPETKGVQSFFIGNIQQISEIIRINNIDEIIYSAKDVSSQIIIGNMLDLSGSVDYKIASPDSISVIGSNSIDTAGDLYTVNLNMITKPENKRNKRLLDIFSSAIFISLSPFLIWVMNNKIKFLLNIFNVFSGNLSWVGYVANANNNNEMLPIIKKGVLIPSDFISLKINDQASVWKTNLDYAKNYKISNDIIIIIRNIKNLDR